MKLVCDDDYWYCRRFGLSSRNAPDGCQMARCQGCRQSRANEATSTAVQTPSAATRQSASRAAMATRLSPAPAPNATQCPVDTAREISTALGNEVDNIRNPLLFWSHPSREPIPKLVILSPERVHEGPCLYVVQLPITALYKPIQQHIQFQHTASAAPADLGERRPSDNGGPPGRSAQVAESEAAVRNRSTCRFAPSRHNGWVPVLWARRFLLARRSDLQACWIQGRLQPPGRPLAEPESRDWRVFWNRSSHHFSSS